MLTRNQVLQAMNLVGEDVDRALRRAGYTDNQISGARFVGLNEHSQFVYEILCIDANATEEFVSVGRVFLSYKEVPLSGIVLLGEF
jgi:hypothetical protein